MAIALSTLVDRLELLAPARDGVPTEADYTQHVKDAVEQLSVDAPMIRLATLNVVSGTATYTLASDFLFLIGMESALNPSGIIIGDNGIIPVGDAFQEEQEITGGQITLYPTPGYTLSRDYKYSARHVLDSGSYTRLTENGARVALLYAQHLAMSQQANGMAGSGWKYQIGDEMVDKTRQADGLRNQALTLLDQYQRAIQPMKGYGSRATYNSQGV